MIRRPDLCVILEDWDSDSSCVEIRCYVTTSGDRELVPVQRCSVNGVIQR
jgi:hypothetical protein